MGTILSNVLEKYQVEYKGKIADQILIKEAIRSVTQIASQSTEALNKIQEKIKNGHLNKVETDLSNASYAASNAQEALFFLASMSAEYPSDTTLRGKCRQADKQFQQIITNVQAAKRSLHVASTAAKEEILERTNQAVEEATQYVLAIYQSQYQGKSPADLQQRLALLEEGSLLKECFKRIVASPLPEVGDPAHCASPNTSNRSTSSNLAPELLFNEVKSVVQSVLENPQGRRTYLTLAQLLDEGDPLLQEDSLLGFQKERGLHLLAPSSSSPMSSSRAKELASLSREGVEELLRMIRESEGVAAENAFKIYLSQLEEGKSITVGDVRAFYKLTLSSAPRANLATYSERSTQFENLDPSGSDQSLSIPQRGFFRAGALLRAELTEDLTALMIEEFNNSKSDQFDKDISRANDFSICEMREVRTSSSTRFQVDSQRSINYQSDPQDLNNENLSNTHRSNFLLRNFVGKEKPYLFKAIASIANQSIGNTTSSIGSGDPRLAPHQRGEEATFSTQPARGFFTQNGQEATLKYSLKKISPLSGDGEEYFILTYDYSCQQPVLFYAKKEGEENAPPSQLNTSESPSSLQMSTSLKIRENSHFDPKAPVTAENFPCTLEALDFINSYEFL